MNILITGATSGIGQQLVTDYAVAGHQIWACGRNQQQLDIMASNNVTTLCFDVSNAAQCRELLTGLPVLDLVILSAGVCEYIDDAQQFDLELVQRVFAVNFFGMLNCAQPLLPQMQAGSKLVFIDSMSRLLPFSRAQAYGASKAAIHYFASSLATDLTPRGINVVTVSPGFVKTPMTDANDFAMPTRISVAEASQAIQKQLAVGKQSIYFPRLFGWLLRLLHLLPDAIQRRIADKLKN
ncbi:SDR family NAD(P)-dependent oxidoreductase [Rheinheimera sp. WS51]|uniref:SDR family NAD(P)-dependent oxidoreductase n=1 Tax=Rheinheimera sp. WS51 TaxID=3425886 RepID=UPI003D8E655A